jgi:hypothetical protein
MKKHLLIFGTIDYNQSVESLSKSAKDYFDTIHKFTFSDIEESFYNENIEILSSHRGAGYWLWKPYFINRILNTINDGDILFYVDAGNIFINNPSVLYNKLEEKNGILLFDNRDGMSSGEYAQNFISCKRDCFILMDSDKDEFIYGKHLNASYQIYQKNTKSLEFVTEYLKFCTNKYIISDTPNMYGDNYPGYYDHRHDQSILSLLAIKHNISPLVDPSEWGNKCKCRDFPQIFLHHRNRNYTTL